MVWYNSTALKQRRYDAVCALTDGLNKNLIMRDRSDEQSQNGPWTTKETTIWFVSRRGHKQCRILLELRRCKQCHKRVYVPLASCGVLWKHWRTTAILLLPGEEPRPTIRSHTRIPPSNVRTSTSERVMLRMCPWRSKGVVFLGRLQLGCGVWMCAVNNWCYSDSNGLYGASKIFYETYTFELWRKTRT